MFFWIMLASRLDVNMCTMSDSYDSVGDTPVSFQTEQGVAEANMGAWVLAFEHWCLPVLFAP